MVNMDKDRLRQLLLELVFTVSRSSGPGGQHVNKTNSKVTISFDLMNSKALPADEKEQLLSSLKNRMTPGGFLILSSQEYRSQHQNKAEVIQKFEALISKGLAKKKKRKKTKPTRSSVLSRLESKKRQSEKKKWRREQ